MQVGPGSAQNWWTVGGVVNEIVMKGGMEMEIGPERNGRETGEGEPALAALEVAARAWAERGDAGPCTRWLNRELDAQGVPRRLPVGAWWPALAKLAEARRRHASRWPEALDERVEGLFR